MKYALVFLLFIATLHGCKDDSVNLKNFTFQIAQSDDVFNSNNFIVIDSEFDGLFNISIDMRSNPVLNFKLEFYNIGATFSDIALNNDWANQNAGHSFAILFGYVDEDVIGQIYVIEDDLSLIKSISNSIDNRYIYEFDRLRFVKDTVLDSNSLLFPDSLILSNGNLAFFHND